MRSLTSFVTASAPLHAALLMAVVSIGCAPDPDDVFDTLLTSTTMTTVGDGDGDTTGDGDGDTTGDGDGDGTGDGDGDGDGDTGCAAGNLNDPCDANCPCAEGLTCDGGTCSLGGGDGDGDGGDGDGDPGECNTYDPMMCAPPGQLVMVGNIEGNFCSCPCTTNQDCPMGPPGTNGGCALVLGMQMAPTNCGLICSVANDACPEGSTCKSAGQMDPDLGLCTYP
jgi:hypothetical protein